MQLALNNISERVFIMDAELGEILYMNEASRVYMQATALREQIAYGSRAKRISSITFVSKRTFGKSGFVFNSRGRWGIIVT